MKIIKQTTNHRDSEESWVSFYFDCIFGAFGSCVFNIPFCIEQHVPSIVITLCFAGNDVLILNMYSFGGHFQTVKTKLFECIYNFGNETKNLGLVLPPSMAAPRYFWVKSWNSWS